jgi:hypothetical protein
MFAFGQTYIKTWIYSITWCTSTITLNSRDYFAKYDNWYYLVDGNFASYNQSEQSVKTAGMNIIIAYTFYSVSPEDTKQRCWQNEPVN